ncbi:unnamed protein product [Trifolium pratense]|uniref:Uncharacterized protein n=1 Tax=Trifolium pratense TaxID=57577 RepID=A0ACB0KLX0_TRIPR|nr:unnamed protein product [Trifolium pratense]
MERHVWIKPPMGTLKCNIDAACYSDLNRFCVAACVRDARGRFVKAYARGFEGRPSGSGSFGCNGSSTMDKERTHDKHSD